MKNKILNTIKDLCSDFLYYDRKEDEELSIADLRSAVNEGIITIDEIVAEFKRNVENTLRGN